ncbi:MAG: hypothetical protein KIT33_01235 [Candidatus Kapabacteria bacterium]|nr:hypothetical protein [Ignavibacteriota bacterium]MCW5883572.1 hypothetical protein [Candidatus Kapabacteria bacterium]
MNTSNNNLKIIFAAGLIFLAAASRLFPVLPNFQPIMAIALFAGAVFSSNKLLGFLIPVSAMLFSDVLLHFFSESLFGYYAGFHSSMWSVYLSFGLIVLLGMKFASNIKPLAILGTSLASAILFFVVTNFSSWMFGLDIMNMPYSKDITGLVRCYTEAIPFFRYTLESVLLYSTVLFGAYKFAETIYFKPITVKAIK